MARARFFRVSVPPLCPHPFLSIVHIRGNDSSTDSVSQQQRRQRHVSETAVRGSCGPPSFPTPSDVFPLAPSPYHRSWVRYIFRMKKKTSFRPLNSRKSFGWKKNKPESASVNDKHSKKKTKIYIYIYLGIWKSTCTSFFASSTVLAKSIEGTFYYFFFLSNVCFVFPRFYFGDDATKKKKKNGKRVQSISVVKKGMGEISLQCILLLDVYRRTYKNKTIDSVF